MQKIPAMDYVSRTEFMLTTVRRMTFDWTVEIRARFAPKNGRECHGFTAIPKYFTKSTVKRDSYFSLSHRIIFFLLYCGNKYYRFELVTSEGQRKSNFVKWKKKKMNKNHLLNFGITFSNSRKGHFAQIFGRTIRVDSQLDSFIFVGCSGKGKR